MKIGMLWFDNSQASLAAKVEAAAAYYLKRYGKAPNLAFVRPTMIDGTTPAGVEIRATRTVQVNHIWIGVNEEGAKA